MKELFKLMDNLSPVEFQQLRARIRIAGNTRENMARFSLDLDSFAAGIGVSSLEAKRIIQGTHEFDMNMVSRLQSYFEEMSDLEAKQSKENSELIKAKLIELTSLTESINNIKNQLDNAGTQETKPNNEGNGS